MFEVSDLPDHLGSTTFPDLDTHSISDILREVDRLAGGAWADSFVDADRNPPNQR